MISTPANGLQAAPPAGGFTDRYEPWMKVCDSAGTRWFCIVDRLKPSSIRCWSRTGANAVYWNRRYEPWATARGERLKTGEPYRVFTPFLEGPESDRRL
jgi:hypothetical protein